MSENARQRGSVRSEAVSALHPRAARRIREWADMWGVPELHDRVEVQTSKRLRTTLGRCRPQTGEIRIAAFLLNAPEPLLDEVLCHELAHAAAFDLHGSRIRAHGPEWSRLMRIAGYAPRSRLEARELDALPTGALPSRIRWEHRCPVCQATRNAGRPVPQWRCSACRGAGLNGDLTITRFPAIRS
jgi:predicted SprT family Zn-dependent metalloprotease